MRGVYRSVTVLDDVPLANWLCDYVEFVVLRPYRYSSSFGGNSENAGRADFHELGADPRVIYQFGNEMNIPHDAKWALGLAKEATAHHRRVVLFTDSVGWTEDTVWLERKEALLYILENGHFVGIHAYGDVTKGDNTYCPMIDPDHPDAYRWFDGRYEHLYHLNFSEDPTKVEMIQPDLIFTEAGAGGFQRNATPQQWLTDVRRENARVNLWPFVKGFNLWTAGGGGALGFERDKLDDRLALLN